MSSAPKYSLRAQTNISLHLFACICVSFQYDTSVMLRGFSFFFAHDPKGHTNILTTLIAFICSLSCFAGGRNTSVVWQIYSNSCFVVVFAFLLRSVLRLSSKLFISRIVCRLLVALGRLRTGTDKTKRTRLSTRSILRPQLPPSALNDYR